MGILRDLLVGVVIPTVIKTGVAPALRGHEKLQLSPEKLEQIRRAEVAKREEERIQKEDAGRELGLVFLTGLVGAAAAFWLGYFQVGPGGVIGHFFATCGGLFGGLYVGIWLVDLPAETKLNGSR